MIKLGTTHKDQVKVDNLVSQINGTKLELEEVLSLTENKKRELNDVLTRLDFAVEDLESKTAQADKEIAIKQNKIVNISAELSELETIKYDLEDKLTELSETIKTERANATEEIRSVKETAHESVKPLLDEIASLENKKSELTQYLEVLSLDISNNEIAVNDIKDEISALEALLEVKRSENISLSDSITEVSNTRNMLASEVITLNEDIKELHGIISNINLEIEAVKAIRDSLTREVEDLTIAKRNLDAEKLAFQANKELILLKEQFII